MPSVHTLLTFDVEVFGNGTGDILYCLIEPTRQLLRCLQDCEARATLFPDVCLLWAIDENERAGVMANLGYSPGELFRKLLTEAVAEGHDVQLHAHPQFVGAQYKALKFEVPETDFWRITDLPEEDDSRPLLSIDGIIGQGIRTLQELLCETEPAYRTTAFRAGMLCSRPEEVLFRVLRRHGIRFDMSGAFGFRCDTGVGKVDFTKVFATPDPLAVGNSYLDHAADGDLIALPLYGARYYPWSEFGPRIKRRLGLAPKPPVWRRERPPNCTGSAHNPGYVLPPPQRFFQRVFSPPNVSFSLDGHARQMIFCARHAIARCRRTGKDVYMVGLGHPKALGDLSQITTFLRWATDPARRDAMKFVTVADLRDHRFDTGFGPGAALTAPPPDAQTATAQAPVASARSA